MNRQGIESGPPGWLDICTEICELLVVKYHDNLWVSLYWSNSPQLYRLWTLVQIWRIPKQEWHAVGCLNFTGPIQIHQHKNCKKSIACMVGCYGGLLIHWIYQWQRSHRWELWQLSLWVIKPEALSSQSRGRVMHWKAERQDHIWQFWVNLSFIEFIILLLHSAIIRNVCCMMVSFSLFDVWQISLCHKN